MVLLLCVSELIDLLEESAFPFIDERDVLTSERERVRMLLSLEAQAVGYKMIVAPTILLMLDACGRFSPWSPDMVNAGAHNTVDAQMHVGGLTAFA